MARTPALLVCFVLGSAIGCRGCEEKRPTSASSPAVVREPESPRAALLARLTARKLDPAKKYPLDPDGAVRCGSDIDCFVAQAERCARASVDHTQTVTGFGVEQRVQAVYRIAGKQAEQCLLERDVLAVDSTFSENVIAALRKKHKSEPEIDNLKSQALADLLDRYPSRIECSFDPDGALTVALDLAEGQYRPQPWRDHCQQLEGPKPQVGTGAPAPDAAP